MSRTIPVVLQDELDKSVPVYTRCLRIEPVDAAPFGAVMLDRDVTYDHGDGFGPVTYSRMNGFDPTTIASDISYSVANAEARMLVAESVPGVTVEMVETGQLDNAKWTLFLVAYDNPVTGGAMILDAGDVGEVRVKKGMVVIPELLSHSMRYRQPVGNVWQRPCRGDPELPRDHISGNGCGWPAEDFWLDFEVTAVGAESNRTFTITIAGTPTLPLFPGRVIWETGDNTSSVRKHATESYDAGVVELIDSLPYAVQVGDTGRIRPDCPKTVEACKARDNFLNHNAEEHIPSGDAVAGSSPGAQVAGWSGGGGGATPPTDTE